METRKWPVVGAKRSEARARSEWAQARGMGCQSSLLAFSGRACCWREPTGSGRDYCLAASWLALSSFVSIQSFALFVVMFPLHSKFCARRTPPTLGRCAAPLRLASGARLLPLAPHV